MRSPLSSKESLFIIENLHKMTPGLMAYLLNRHRQTIISFILRHKERGAMDNYPKTPRKRSIPFKLKLKLIKIIEKEPGIKN